MGVLKLLDLLLEELSEELAEFIKCDFTRLVFVKDSEDDALALILIVLLVLVVVDPNQQ